MAAPDEGETLAEVDLPAVARVVGGQARRRDPSPGPRDPHRSRRRGVRRERGVAGDPRGPEAGHRLRDGGATDGSYVRVAAREPSGRPGPAGTRVRAVFTSLAEEDLARIDRLIAAEPARTGAGHRSP